MHVKNLSASKQVNVREAHRIRKIEAIKPQTDALLCPIDEQRHVLQLIVSVKHRPDAALMRVGQERKPYARGNVRARQQPASPSSRCSR